MIVLDDQDARDAIANDLDSTFVVEGHCYPRPLFFLGRTVQMLRCKSIGQS